MTAIILAGGRSRRMKADKAALAVGTRTLLEHVLAQVAPYFDEVLISVSPGQDLPPLASGRSSRTRRPASLSFSAAFDVRVVPDDRPGLGPIGGLLAGLRAARNDACLVVACDIPEVPSPLLHSLARAARDAEIAVPVDPAGRYEPLFAIYRRSIIPAIAGLVERGERSLLPLYRICPTKAVPLKAKGRLRNLNTREDYEAYLRSTRASEAGNREGPVQRAGAARRRERPRGALRRGG